MFFWLIPIWVATAVRRGDWAGLRSGLSTWAWLTLVGLGVGLAYTAAIAGVVGIIVLIAA